MFSMDLYKSLLACIVNNPSFNFQNILGKKFQKNWQELKKELLEELGMEFLEKLCMAFMEPFGLQFHEKP